MADHADIRRRLPPTDAVLADLRLARALRELGTVPFKEAVRAAQRWVRAASSPRSGWSTRCCARFR